VFRELTLRNGILVLGILGIAVGFAYHVSGHPMDFRVYHYGARGVFDGTRPVYGLTSGLGWPMHYRYPPLFLLLFAPFAWLPLGAASAVWVILKIAVLVWLVQALSLRERAERGVFLPRSGEGKDEMSRTFPSPGLRPSSPGGRGCARPNSARYLPTANL
jgi:hypothetical protein